MEEASRSQCTHDHEAVVPDQLGMMAYNPKTKQVEAPVLTWATRCLDCGRELPCATPPERTESAWT